MMVCQHIILRICATTILCGQHMLCVVKNGCRHCRCITNCFVWWNGHHRSIFIQQLWTRLMRKQASNVKCPNVKIPKQMSRSFYKMVGRRAQWLNTLAIFWHLDTKKQNWKVWLNRSGIMKWSQKRFRCRAHCLIWRNWNGGPRNI